MAINPETEYPGKITPSSVDYPFGSARNITLPGDGTGTPWEAAIVNDLLGFQQSILSAASIVPSGTPDKVRASQYLQGLNKLYTLSNDNLADALARLDISLTVPAMVIHVVERTAGQVDGGSFWKVVETSAVTPNTHNIVVATGLPALSLQLIVGDITKPAHFGVVYDAKFRNGSGDYFKDVGLAQPATNNQLAMQAAWDYAYLNNGNLHDSFGSALVNSIVTPPVSVTEPRGDTFTVRGAGAGNVFVTAIPDLVTAYVNNQASPVLDTQDRKGFVNTGGAFDISGIRFEGNSNLQVLQFDQFGEFASLKGVEIKQFGIGDGIGIDYFMKGNIERINILNSDAFSSEIPRTGTGIRIKAGDGGGIPTIKKITSRGFNAGYILGENATTSDNMSGLKLEQCESSFVKLGIDIREFTLKPTLDTCYFEGIEEVHIDDKGTASDIHSCIHFINATSAGGVTFYKSNGATKGNRYHHNYLETDRDNDTLVDVTFDDYKSVDNNTIIYSGTTRNGLSGIIVRGLFAKLDLSSNAFLPRGAWLGGNVTGTHNGGNNQAVLTDTTASFNPGGLIGITITNSTDGSSGTITANTATTITATLAGGTDNDWDTSDAYSIDNDTTKIRYLHTGNAMVGVTEAQNGDNFSCPLVHGAISFITGQTVLTEANVSGNTLTLPDDVNHFTFTPTIAVSINTIVGSIDNFRPVFFDITNTNVTFTNSALVKVDGGASYTGLGSIEFQLRRSGGSFFAKERFRNAYV